MDSLNNNFIRSMLVVILCCIFYGIIGFNLYLIQIQQNSFFKNLGEKQYNVTMQTFPQRAYIYDRNNNPVAINKDSLSAFILPKGLCNEKETLEFLKKHFTQAHDKFNEYKNKSFMFIKRNLTESDIELIKKYGNTDINILKESSRFYPYESMGSILGITDIDNHGQFGLELQYNQKLQGTPTTFKLKKDAKAHHFYFSKEMKEQGTEGIALAITIDAVLQHKFQKILTSAAEHYGAQEGGAIAIDPMTGEILAAASFPTFDPNSTKNLCMEYTKCRPITNCFEFGSVIKTFAALTALQEGATTLDEEIDCQNTKETYIDGLRIRTVYPNGKINFIEVMQNSNNIGVVKVMKRVGPTLYDYYKMLGFGQTTGLHFPGEQKGFVNHPSNWSAYSIQSLSYGYEITTSLLQLARAFSMIVNDGYLIQPKIIKNDLVQATGPFLSQKTLGDIKQLLTAIVQEHGALKANIAGYTVYGKTGTAHILENGQYNENRHLYSFVGAIEKDGYKRVIACYLKDSTKRSYASYVTAPLFKQLAEAMILHEQP
jgi:cell division protein FtsI (penicillin-binding protein 3)